MTNEFAEIATKAMALTAADRAELAELLIRSLDEKENGEIESAWLAEIRQRDEEIRSGAAVTIPADQALREARARLRCMQ
jgi:putative addiction module component (TIGR02574 family)